MKKIYSFLIVFGFISSAFSQELNIDDTKALEKDTAKRVLDGYYVKSNTRDRKVVEYPHLRQADVAYKRRIWREIDLREKLNSIFASPNARLMDILVEAIQEGKLKAYDPTPTAKNPTGDNFELMEELSIDQVLARLGGDSVLVEEFNENNEVVSSRYEKRAFNGENVLKFRIKEDWIFDKQRSVFEPRIIGIAPLITPNIPGMDAGNVYNSMSDGGTSSIDPFDPFAPKESNSTASSETSVSGAVPVVSQDGFLSPQIDPTPVFWIYFPEARNVLVNKEVMNRNNAATGLTYDDIFIKRIFTSYIVKQDNPEDLRIKDYISDDLGRLYESERIKKQLLDWEQDLWSY